MELSLSDETIRGIIARLAHLRAACGDAFADPDLIEPNGEYFPDEFRLDPQGIDRLLRRMLSYAPLSDDLDIGLGFIEPDGETNRNGGCGSGACGTGRLEAIARGGAIETEHGYAALVHVQDVGDPAILTTALARSIGRIVIFEVDEDLDARDEGALSELTAIASGFGLLLLNGSCVYKKGCGGMKRHQATFLDIEEIALGLALFVRATKKKPGTVRSHLEITQKEAFDAALAWVDGQPTIVHQLAEEPEKLSDGVFPFEEKKGLFARLFTKKPEHDLAPISTQRRERSEEEHRRIAEAKALVEEALSEP